MHSFVSTHLDYCNSVLYGIADNQLQRLQSVLNAAARLVTSMRRTKHITPVLQSLHWLPVRQWIIYKLATLVHKCLTYLAEYYRQAGTRRPGMRSAGTSTLDVPRTRTALCDRSFAVAGPRIWNSLPAGVAKLSIRPKSIRGITFTRKESIRGDKIVRNTLTGGWNNISYPEIKYPPGIVFACR